MSKLYGSCEYCGSQTGKHHHPFCVKNNNYVVEKLDAPVNGLGEIIREAPENEEKPWLTDKHHPFWDL